MTEEDKINLWPHRFIFIQTHILRDIHRKSEIYMENVYMEILSGVLSMTKINSVLSRIRKFYLANLYRYFLP